MSDNWETIYSTNQMYEAELVREIMEDNEIECVIMNKQDSAYHLGDIEICVSTDNILKAKQLIQEFKGE